MLKLPNEKSLVTYCSVSLIKRHLTSVFLHFSGSICSINKDKNARQEMRTHTFTVHNITLTKAFVLHYKNSETLYLLVAK